MPTVDSSLAGLISEVTNILKHADGSMTNLGKQITHLSPELTKTLYHMIQYNCLGNLLVGMICLAIAIPSLKACYKYTKRLSQDSDGVYVTLALVGTGIGLTALCLLLNIWNWVGLFDQQAWIANEVVNLITTKVSN